MPQADRLAKTTEDAESGPRTRSPHRYCVRWCGRLLVLGEGTTTVGRHPGCQLVFDSPQVSRRHARIVVSPQGISIEDLGSRNGILVGGMPITGCVTVLPGQKIRIGDQEIEIERHESATPSVPMEERQNAATMAYDATEAPDEQESTRATNVLGLLGAVIDKMIALGRGEEAERLLAGHLDRLLQEVRSGRAASLADCETAAQYAVRLAEFSRRADWVDYAVALFSELGRPLPMPVIDQMYALLRRVRGVNVTALRDYVALLQSDIDGFGPADRFAVSRLEGLIALVGA